MMQRYFLEIAFDGTKYFGWQVQPNHISVQEKITTILSKLYDTKIEIVGCGRTDTGVHALQYFLHFDTPIVRKKYADSIKLMMPNDIQLLSIRKVHSEAHARFDATSRSYTYKLHQKKDVFQRHYSFEVDLSKLNEVEIHKACNVFTMQDNYAVLCKKNPLLKDYVSKVTEAVWQLSEDEKSIVFIVSANRFLHNQIRRMVGVLLNIGLGKISVEELENAMKNEIPLLFNDKAPAKGLFLHSIKYPFIKQ